MAGRVTALTRVSDDPPLVDVYVDGAKLLTVPEEAVSRLGLSVGSAFGAGEPEPAPGHAADDTAAAREAALRLLAVRARSRSELSDRLRRKGHAPAVVREVVDSLAAVGLVDDRAFAELWADERMRLRPVGRRRLAQELRAKGVPPEVTDGVLDQAFAATSERALALRVARARAGKSGSGPKARARLHALLLRRGFSYGVTAEVVREVMGELDE